MMLVKLAWRNIWRNKRRSIIVLGSIVVGTFSIIFLDSFMIGSMNQWEDNQLSAKTTFLQIFRNGYNNNKVIQNYIPEKEKVTKILDTAQNIKAYSERVCSFGLVNSATNSSGINFLGIDFQKEPMISKIHQYIYSGKYLSGKKHEILIGKKLAEKLEVELGDKIVIMTSNIKGEVSSDIFRITGIFRSASTEFDNYYVYINKDNAQEILGFKNEVTEIAITLNNPSLVDNVKEKIKSSLTEYYEVFSYKDLLPFLTSMVETSKSSMLIFYVIIALAMVFGIINTKMMSVFERTREFGILMANGMKIGKIFQMILIEAFFIGSIGFLTGMIIAIFINIPVSHYGINFTALAGEYSTSMGFASIVYPVLETSTIIQTGFTIILTTILGALYPAVKAIKLEPVKALRFV